MKPSGAIGWMASNHVVANLIMWFLLLGGALSGWRLQQEVFPEFALNLISITVTYRGASPEEVEQGILLAIEEKVRGLEGIEKVRSIAVEGSGIVYVELLRGVNRQKLLQDVKNRVDSITSFPEEADRPIVTLLETKKEVISLILYGEATPQQMRQLAEQVRDELLQQKEGITQLEIANLPEQEISIEVSQATLRRYKLTLEQVAERVRTTALELPAGGIKAKGGEVLLRTQERRDYAEAFEDIPILTASDGSTVALKELAQIEDLYEESDQETRFNGKNGVRIDLFRVGDQRPLDISKLAIGYAKELQARLPPSIYVTTWNDQSELFRDRIDLLVRNALMGLLLVLLLLGLFLEPRLAFWVTLGIPVSALGSFLLIPLMGVTLNMVSLFGFLITIGIVVDDSIVVGEQVYQFQEEGVAPLEAAIRGTNAIAVPVFFAVFTNILSFLPLFFVPGDAGEIFFQIPAVVVSIFTISLLESLFILPAHLAVFRKKSAFWHALAAPSRLVGRWLHSFIQGSFKKMLHTTLQWRYLTIALATAVQFFCIGLVVSGVVPFSYLPRVDGDLVTAQLRLPQGVPMALARKLEAELIAAAEPLLKDDQGRSIVRGIYTQIGMPIESGGAGPVGKKEEEARGSHLVGAQLLLVPSDQRSFSGIEVAKRWRALFGRPAGVENSRFNATLGNPGGDAIDIQLAHNDRKVLEEAARELTEAVGTYQGTADIDNGVATGKRQLSFTLTPEGKAAGLSVQEMARQLRSAFEGSEAIKQQRGRHEVRVVVRLPKEEREELDAVEQLILRTAKGGEIPLFAAANVREGRAYTKIERDKGRRTLEVTADVDESLANSGRISADLEKEVLPELLKRYPGLSYSLEGQQKEKRESLEGLAVGYLFALLAIYMALAIPFKSYVQPLVVMISIPFGIIGALIGHLLLGYELSIISMLGIIALSGVVVNDALVLVVTINELIRDGALSPFEAVASAPLGRFRPIMLTSLTTFFGLVPIVFEPSIQARFLIPMAISLAFGVLFSTLIVLFLVPCLYLALEDLGLTQLDKRAPS